jgi:hypothetical protein
LTVFTVAQEPDVPPTLRSTRVSLSSNAYENIGRQYSYDPKFYLSKLLENIPDLDISSKDKLAQDIESLAKEFRNLLENTTFVQDVQLLIETISNLIDDSTAQQMRLFITTATKLVTPGVVEEMERYLELVQNLFSND